MRSVQLGLFLLVSLCACGGGEKKVPTAPTNHKEDSGPGRYMNDAGSGDSGKMESLGPKVTITSPLAAKDPNVDDVITAKTVKVTCKVERAAYSGAAAVDKSMVKIALQKPDDTDVWTDAPVNVVDDETYEALFELGAYPNGPVHFRCVARDLATLPQSNRTQLDTFVDLGPKIEIKSPKAIPYALKTAVPIEFKIEASPVSSADTEAAVDKITLEIAGAEAAFEESSEEPGLYHASADFDDRTLFPVPPKSAQIAIRATNKRSPTAVERSASIDIVIDGDGPSVVVKGPPDGSIVHGDQSLEVEVKDASGIRPESVVANFNQGLLIIKDWDRKDATFRKTFDTRYFGTKLTRLTVAITAMDTVGNETTVSHLLKLDNLPPVISLTPPLIREWRKNGGNIECSALFDPVGDDVPNDGEPLTAWGYFRVLVEDKTNAPIVGPNDPEPVTYIAGINNSTVELYMQRDTSLPFLIDTDGDQICDEINIEALAEEKRPRKIGLSPVNPVGSAWYKTYDSVEGASPSSNPYADNAPCMAKTTAMPVNQPEFPNRVCLQSIMHRVIPGRVSGRPPGVYALRPTNNTQTECTGEYWELYGIADPGWICLAARVEDTKGNIGISEPVRLCYGETENMTPDCSNEPMPTCRRDCTISEAQKYHYVDVPFNSTNGWYFP